MEITLLHCYRNWDGKQATDTLAINWTINQTGSECLQKLLSQAVFPWEYLMWSRLILIFFIFIFFCLCCVLSICILEWQSTKGDPSGGKCCFQPHISSPLPTTILIFFFVFSFSSVNQHNLYTTLHYNNTVQKHDVEIGYSDFWYFFKAWP